jgi:hypothetical protein
MIAPYSIIYRTRAQYKERTELADLKKFVLRLMKPEDQKLHQPN